MDNLIFIKKILFDNPLGDLIDIFVVAFFLYQFFMLIEGTRAMVLVKGIAVLMSVRAVSAPFGLNEINWLLESFLPAGFLALVVLFQSELRRALERIGQGFFFTSFNDSANAGYVREIEALMAVLKTLAQRKTGALIVMERNIGLREHYENCPMINAAISEELIHTIFFKDTPLHDGAMIIRGAKIVSAAVFLPLSNNPNLEKSWGTRHRAALGISEQSDALVIVVSEERGSLTYMLNAQIHSDVDEKVIRSQLEVYYRRSPAELNSSVLEGI